MDFRVAPQAESDLDEIWYFLATQSSSIDVADRVIDSITARFRSARAPTVHRAVVGMKTCDQACAVSLLVTT
jgi:plasmid stabilization system protein ParE